MKVYIEAGANDGVFQSRTLKYKGVEGWKGILIEPDPRCYEDLMRNRFDVNTCIFNVALVSNEHQGSTITFNQHHASAMNSVEGCCTRGEKFQDSIKVEAMTLGRILKMLNVKEVEELYLDVEGYEYQVLQGIGPDVKIKWAEIELHRHDTPEAEEEYESICQAGAALNMMHVSTNTADGHPKMILIENTFVPA
jgi:FkbM family methyltransferase